MTEDAMEPVIQRVDGNGKLSLVRKLAEVMAAVERVPKSGRNDFHRYDYATEADIVAAVRLSMAERNVMMVPTVVDTKWSEVQRAKGGADRLCTLSVRFTLHDGESGEQLAFDVVGEGQDAGDKASYKAFTGAVKYALLKLFLIPTGDDPEDDGAHGAKGRTPPPNARQSTSGPAKGEATPARSEPPSQSATRAAEAAPLPAPTTVSFGPYKGTPFPLLNDGQLDATIGLGMQKLEENPAANWRNKMKAELAALDAELSRRMKAHAEKAAAQPAEEKKLRTDDEIPF